MLSCKDIVFNNQGIDTITQIAYYETIKKLIEKEGLKIEQNATNLPLSSYIKSLENSLKFDKKLRYKKDDFKLSFEFVKFAKGKTLNNYMIIIKNTPFLMNHALKHKKAKDTFCLLVYAGLHQPTKKTNNQAVKFISKMIKRKSFKIIDIDIATDYKTEKRINYKMKNEFKNALKGLENNSYIVKKSSLYTNDTKDKQIDKILLYDKGKKHIEQKQKLSDELTKWQRLEITFKLNKPMSFNELVKSDEFRQILTKNYKIAKRLNLGTYEVNFLEYQISSLLDNRAINNNKSKKQFNSVESLERFKNSQFKPYRLNKSN